MLTHSHLLHVLSKGEWVLPLLLPSVKRTLDLKAVGSFNLVTQGGLKYYGHAEAFIPSTRLDSIFPSQFIHFAFGPDCESMTFQPTEKNLIMAAIKSLSADWPAAGLCMESIESFGRVRALNALGASHPHAVCSIFYGDSLAGASADQVEQSLVHELGHQELFTINLIDRLVSPAADKIARTSPLQRRDRPTIARLHAAAALTRMIQLTLKTGHSSDNLRFQFDNTLDSFADGDLTDFGTKLVDALRTSVQKL